MAKYDPLKRHLAALQDIEWTPSFSEIEEILGGPLPASATEHRTWWANSGGLLVHQEAWLTAGWRVESVEISRRQVTFRRKGVGMPAARARPAQPKQQIRADDDGGMPKALRKVLDASRKTVNLSARIDWTDVGIAHKDGEHWRFPQAASVPALCRFHIFTGEEHGVLVAAVPDLDALLRRLETASVNGYNGHSAPPGMAVPGLGEPGIQEIEAAMRQADYIGVDAATPGQAWILVDGRGRKADLTNEDECWLVARAAAVVDRQAGLEPVLLIS
ncbi:hypothetical protein [Breoghania sp. L-A4]|uniref:DUF7662 domain-containing protein n=1 Tax=Breoghania sp. L-A4 TaxID=2304600 RepID=UPI000E360BFA|nr:hypothetical protein [Breoghania sp. L-A4]AXS39034.1 hypothetical protein D1F64_01860 [Breoghania sp. L-A4]